MGIEPTRPAWKAGILAIELHPHLNKGYIITNFINSQEFFEKRREISLKAGITTKIYNCFKAFLMTQRSARRYSP